MKELTVNGYKLVVSSISPLAPKSIEMQYRKQHPEPQPPTYKVEAVGGVTEEFPHTRETVETTEEKEALLKYEENLNTWMAELSLLTMRMFLTQGVELHLTKKQVEKAKNSLKLLGMNLPTDEQELNLLILEMFVIQKTDDMEKISQAILAETGISQEVLETAEATFLT